MELVLGRHYMYHHEDSDVLIEVEYTGEGVSNTAPITKWHSFKCVKTGNKYSVIPEHLDEYISDIEVVSGTKHDHGKLLWGLLPLESVQEIVKVLTFGATKYKPHNWKYVEDAEERYYDAMMRHIVSWKLGETRDQDTGLHPLAHVGCCLLFLLWFELTKKRDMEE